MTWMHKPRYMATDFSTEFDAFTGRILSLVFSDDHLSHSPPLHSIKMVLNTLPQADRTCIELDPAALGWSPVGHINAFSKDRKNDVWKGILQWVQYGEISPNFRGERWDSEAYKLRGSSRNKIMAKI